MRKYSGYISAGIYVLLQSISFVFLDKVISHLNPLVALLAMSAWAILVFNALAWGGLGATYRACWHYPFIFLVMVAALALDWVCMLYASYFTDPFIALSALFISLAIIGFSWIYVKTRQHSAIFSILALSSCVPILGCVYQLRVGQQIWYGLGLGVMAGCAFYIYMACSAKFAQLGNLSALQVLATRFWLLFLGGLILVPKPGLLLELQQNFLVLGIISLGVMVIPIYFNQQAIMKLGSDVTAIIISFVPPLTYFIYVLLHKALSLVNLSVCVIITMALLLPKLAEALHKNSATF